MKKLYTIVLAVLLTASVFAQSPEKMSYQAVIRNSSNQLVTDTQIGMQISILQGSASGTAVYVETQTPTTNANGLVSVEIGIGTVESGTFATIDWANGPFFIKTETAVEAPLTTYTITGTSQLLSVPYALHAKTAETVTGTITETDPAVAANFDFTDAASGDLLQFNGTKWVKVTPDYISDYTVTETDVTAHEAALTVTESQISDLGTYIEAETDPTVTKYSVGDFAQGGIVFWVDETGQHGLVAAKVDQSTGVRWYAGTFGSTQAKGDGPFSGEANTSIIIAAQVAIGDDGSTYAARICNELQVTEGGKTYGDWYLPSKDELNLMYQNKATIDATAGANGGSDFALAYYWSSTEYNNNYAWDQYFANGYQGNYLKNGPLRVRAVRAF